MKNNRLTVLLVLIFLISCEKELPKIAKIQFNKEINFGVINTNDTIVKTFYLRNTSSNLLKIKQVKTGCGCTIAKLKDSIIKPNSKAEIMVQYVADNDQKGEINKSIVIDANTNPNFTVLYLKGRVE